MDSLGTALTGLLGRPVTDPSAAFSGIVRAANGYPVQASIAAAFSFNSLTEQYPAFAAKTGQQAEELKQLLKQVVEAVEPWGAEAIMEALDSAEDDDGDLTPLYDFLDRLREVAETYVDEAKGQHSSQQVALIQGQLTAAAAEAAQKKGAGGAGGAAGAAASTNGTGHALPLSSPTPARRLPPSTSGKVKGKPQALFEDSVDNDRETVWLPKLRERYHSKGSRNGWVPQRYSPSAALAAAAAAGATQGGGSKGSSSSSSSSFSGAGSEGSALQAYSPSLSVSHPYSEEIRTLAYPFWQLHTVPPQDFSTLEATELTFVKDSAGLAALLAYLEGSQSDAAAEGEGMEQEEGGTAGSGDCRLLGAAASSAASSSSSSSSSSFRSKFSVPLQVPLRHPRGPEGFAPVREIALDLEAHSVRSYQGFCCLMQLSTRERDFLIDTLALRSELHVLNRLFCNPAVVKVLHGCDSDVLWLQRDFGLYLVNVFDTGQASRVLGYPSAGLAHLLLKFPGVTANKEFQMADWRERPLPAELLKYAREDTHYLLGIYDRLRNELIASSADKVAVRVAGSATAAASSSSSSSSAGSKDQQQQQQEVPSLLASVLQRSMEKSLQVYSKEQWSPRAYTRLMVKLGLRPKRVPRAAGGSAAAAGGAGGAGEGEEDGEGGGGQGLDRAEEEEALLDEDATNPRARVFAALYDWRDTIARREDESTNFVLPNRLLARLTEQMPVRVEDLVRCCNPIPVLVRQAATEVCGIIARARGGVPDAHYGLLKKGTVTASGAIIGEEATVPLLKAQIKQQQQQQQQQSMRLSGSKRAAEAAAEGSEAMASTPGSAAHGIKKSRDMSAAAVQTASSSSAAKKGGAAAESEDSDEAASSRPAMSAAERLEAFAASLDSLASSSSSSAAAVGSKTTPPSAAAAGRLSLQLPAMEQQKPLAELLLLLLQTKTTSTSSSGSSSHSSSKASGSKGSSSSSGAAFRVVSSVAEAFVSLSDEEGERQPALSSSSSSSSKKDKKASRRQEAMEEEEDILSQKSSSTSSSSGSRTAAAERVVASLRTLSLFDLLGVSRNRALLMEQEAAIKAAEEEAAAAKEAKRLEKQQQEVSVSSLLSAALQAAVEQVGPSAAAAPEAALASALPAEEGMLEEEEKEAAAVPLSSSSSAAAPAVDPFAPVDAQGRPILSLQQRFGSTVSGKPRGGKDKEKKERKTDGAAGAAAVDAVLSTSAAALLAGASGSIKQSMQAAASTMVQNAQQQYSMQNRGNGGTVQRGSKKQTGVLRGLSNPYLSRR